MNKPIFRDVKKGDRPSANEHNMAMQLLSGLANSLHINSYVDSTGFHTRRMPGTSLQIKIFEVQGPLDTPADGIYKCYEQTLDATEWEDTAGDDKFDDKDSVEVEVLNLLENNPAADYMHGLVVGDRITAWQWFDDEGNNRWVGIPIVENVRRAKIEALQTDHYDCRLLNRAGNKVGSVIDVYPIEHLGTNALSGAVWPDYAVNDVLAVFWSVDDTLNRTWHTQFPVDDTTACD